MLASVLSVHLSVKCVDCDKTEEGYVQMFIPYERPFSLVSERIVGGGDPFYLKFWVKLNLLEQK